MAMLLTRYLVGAGKIDLADYIKELHSNVDIKLELQSLRRLYFQEQSEEKTAVCNKNSDSQKSSYSFEPSRINQEFLVMKRREILSKTIHSDSRKAVLFVGVHGSGHNIVRDAFLPLCEKRVSS